MESRIKPSMSMIKGASLDRMRRGAMLVTVLIITAVGLLFGAGALLLFKYQSQMRVDRQHELEKVYAVRSVLNYIKRSGNTINREGSTFESFTRSGRELRVIAKPVKRIFPDFENPLHLDMMNEGRNDRYFLGPKENSLDYEYGVSDEKLTNGFHNYRYMYGLLFPDKTAETNAKWWVNIGMPGTGGWAQEQYGRRYYFEPRDYVGQVDSDSEKDVIRFCLIRNTTNINEKTGYRYGWPLTKPGERAIVLEVRPSTKAVVTGNLDEMGMSVSEWVYTGGIPEIEIRNKFAWNDKMYSRTAYIGLQIAGDNISLYYSQKGDTKLWSGYIFCPETHKMLEDTYKYFTSEITFDGITYPGMVTNDYGVIKAPELRAVFEIEAMASKRPKAGPIDPDGNDVNFLTDFGVAPAYQYDVFLEHPKGITNLATVAQRVLLAHPQGRNGAKFSVRTYDTHGTENKGFRKDEKLKREQGR